MSSFKVTCKIQDEKKGIHEHDVYVSNAKDSDDAERKVKYYFLLERTDVVYYGVVKIVEI